MTKLFKEIGLKTRNIDYMFYSVILDGLIFFIPIVAIFYNSVLNSMTKVAMVFAIASITVAITEVPSGAIADLFGRKNTLIAGEILRIIALTALLFKLSFAIIIIHAILRSIGRSLKSGTNHSLIFDSLKEEKKEKYYKKIIGKYFSLWAIGASIGSIIGGLLAKISLRTPYIVTIIPAIIALIFLTELKEPKYETEKHKNIFQHLIKSTSFVIKKKQLLIILIGGLILYGLSETTHEMNSLFFSFKAIPIVWFGIAGALVFGFSSIGMSLSDQISKKIGNKKTIIYSIIGTAIFIIIATQLKSYLAVLFYVASSLFYGMRTPVLNYLINLETPSSKRATVHSINNLVRFLGMTIIAPLIGYFAELYNINTAFLLSGIGLFIAVIIFYFIKNKK